MPHRNAALLSARFALCALLAIASLSIADEQASGHRAVSVRVVVLSTMLAEGSADGTVATLIGEWGYSALVEVDGRKILFDTGARPDTVLKNARALGIDLSDVVDVVLTHNHADHTGGLLTLRRELSRQNPQAMSCAHVGKGIFWSRPSSAGEKNKMIALRQEYESAGGVFVEHAELDELAPGVWLTGPVPRKYPERNWSVTGTVSTPSGVIEDNIPEDMAMVIDTDRGLVVVSGCGHAGIVNTLTFARERIRQVPIYAAIGGFHLFRLDDVKLQWTGERLKEMDLGNLLGGHCTGIESVFRIREAAGLSRRSAIVSAVGSSFTLDKGIDPGPLGLAR